MKDPQLFTSKSEHWCTPEKLLERVRRFDTIGLDPCSNPFSIVGATTQYSLVDGNDGLLLTWQNQGLVYVNPPYGKQLNAWVKKISAESLVGTEIIALLPSRTDTKFFQDYVTKYGTSLLFHRGRIVFIDGLTGNAKNPATFPSILVYYGERKTRFRKVFGDLGYLVDL